MEEKKLQHHYRWQDGSAPQETPLIADKSGATVAVDLKPKSKSKAASDVPAIFKPLVMTKEAIRSAGRSILPTFIQEHAADAVIGTQAIAYTACAYSGWQLGIGTRTLASTVGAAGSLMANLGGIQREETPEEKAKIDKMGWGQYGLYQIWNTIDFISPKHFLRSHHKRQFVGGLLLATGILTYRSGTLSKSGWEKYGALLNWANGPILMFTRDEETAWQTYGLTTVPNAVVGFGRIKDASKLRYFETIKKTARDPWYGFGTSGFITANALALCAAGREGRDAVPHEEIDHVVTAIETLPTTKVESIDSVSLIKPIENGAGLGSDKRYDSQPDARIGCQGNQR